VIRDIMGTGLGAKPICSTDIFCFAPPDTPADALPPGALHPKRVMRGVIEGVRDYGNRMGIPTVNGAVYFDKRYLGNPLVYCGNVGLLPRGKSQKQRPEPGDLIVAVGGRTGRDGIHGATFSSAELTSQSDQLSGGAVQIGNAIEEKKVLDVLLAARDLGLFHAMTDCGAGGFSSAIGEMGEKIGAEVHLERAPLKYAGLSYPEIWISEAQERMVLAVPEEKWPALQELCSSEGVEATSIGVFSPTGRLRLTYHGQQVADLEMKFLHDGRPPVVRQAEYRPAALLPLDPQAKPDYTDDLLRILASPNVASKEWIIRQYDHEVQGGSVVKPLVGVHRDGPSDAAVLRPVLNSRRGVVIGCGMNPRYGEFDSYHMAASAIDEAVRNCVAVGADPARIAILDNFCWGDCERPETLGSLVRAAMACHDLSLALGTPFISGKDSLNNEFSYTDAGGERQTIAIPASLLISAIGQMEDVGRAVTMDLKSPGNLLYLAGETKNELGGSHYAFVNGMVGGQVPTVDPGVSRQTFAALHHALSVGCIRACHDLSEGGLAVAVAEMAIAGGYGAQVDLDSFRIADGENSAAVRLFSESNARFVCEVAAECAAEFERALNGVPVAKIGEVNAEARLTIAVGGRPVVDASIQDLKAAWQGTLVG
jgi:phosphoribosylformylglycinamidine synthase subunit PurSL